MAWRGFCRRVRCCAQTLYLFAQRDFSYQELIQYFCLLLSSRSFPHFSPTVTLPPSIQGSVSSEGQSSPSPLSLCLRRPAVHQPLVRLQRPSRPADTLRRLPGRVPRPPLPGREGRPLLAPAGTHQQRVQRGGFSWHKFEWLGYLNAPRSTVEVLRMMKDDAFIFDLDSVAPQRLCIHRG